MVFALKLTWLVVREPKQRQPCWLSVGSTALSEAVARSWPKPQRFCDNPMLFLCVFDCAKACPWRDFLLPQKKAGHPFIGACSETAQQNRIMHAEKFLIFELCCQLLKVSIPKLWVWNVLQCTNRPLDSQVLTHRGSGHAQMSRRLAETNTSCRLLQLQTRLRACVGVKWLDDLPLCKLSELAAPACKHQLCDLSTSSWFQPLPYRFVREHVAASKEAFFITGPMGSVQEAKSATHYISSLMY